MEMVTMMEGASTFISRGMTCAGTLYLPKGERPSEWHLARLPRRLDFTLQMRA